MWFLKLLRQMKRFLTGRRPAGQVVYSLPNAAVYRKFFNRDQFFDEVDWSDWKAVIDGFEQRFDKWYFASMSGGHASYVDLCALCALIDVFSLYQSEGPWHAARTYKEFLRKLDPAFRKRLHGSIRISRYEAGTWKATSLKDVADVFYVGVRCSLHHHGDLASFAGMSGTGELARELPDAGLSLCGTLRYSLVVFDPAVLKLCLRLWLANYCNRLRSTPSSKAACAFKARLRSDFGIAVP
jgi:hypothetical protein